VRSRAAAVAGLLLALAVLVTPSQAKTHDVSLTVDGPVPRTLQLKPGDRVQFVNNDSVPHQVNSRSGWQFNSGPIPPGRVSPETPPLTAPGTYSYDDVRGLFFATFEGRLVIPKPSPTPSPTATRTASPTPSPTKASPAPSPTRSPSPSPIPTPTATPTPSASASPSAVPSPSAAATSLPPTAPEIRYGVQQALVQSSPHRYGLPALIAAVGVVGVLSLLLRYLLFLAPRGGERQRW